MDDLDMNIEDLDVVPNKDNYIRGENNLSFPFPLLKVR